MKFREFTIIGVGAMILFQLITSFTAIRLLTRMSPAIEQILWENVASIEAAETMLASLATNEDSVEAPKPFKDALKRAQNNVTEDEEIPVLKSITRRMDAAFQGDATARSVLSEDILKLSNINRASMRRADHEAKRIGSAGAWTMALLGIMGLFFWVLVFRRVLTRLVGPLDEIQRVFEAQDKGNYQRRVVPAKTDIEMHELAALINRMLDARLDMDGREHRKAERVALVGLLDDIPVPAVLIMQRDHTRLAANRAMQALADDPKAPDAERMPDFSAIPDGLPSGWSVRDMQGLAWLVSRETH